MYEEFKSDKKEKMLEALVDSKADCVMCNFSVIDENRNVLIEKFYENSPISKNLVVNILKSKFLGCCMAFSRDLLQKALPFPVKLIAHDYWIGCLSEKFIFLNEPLHLYRRYFHSTDILHFTDLTKCLSQSGWFCATFYFVFMHTR